MITFPPKLTLANIPTPIEELTYRGKNFLIKRDDYTGVELSGNKIRKLEYLLAEALQNKAEHIITCGGEQSNHARATVIASAKIGLPCTVYVWGTPRTVADGNLFLDTVFGANIIYLSKKEYFSFVENPHVRLERDFGKKLRYAFFTEGGSTTTGIMGYVEAFSEMAFELKQRKVKDIVVAAGTGGTAAGLLIGAAIYNFPVTINIVNVLYDADTIKEKIHHLVAEVCSTAGLDVSFVMKRLKVLNGFSDEGYKEIRKEKIEIIKDFARQTGILLDPVYTGKAFIAFTEQFLHKKTKSLFLHTGGIFGAFAQRKKYLID